MAGFPYKPFALRGAGGKRERETASDGTGESLLQNANGVLPGGIAGPLRERRSGEKKCEIEGDQR